jgi:hypothetical protein
MSITIDDVPKYQVLDVHQGDISYLSLFAGGLTADQAAALTATLGGTDSLFFQDPPVVMSATPTSVSCQYLVILSITGAVADEVDIAGMSDDDVFGVMFPLDPALTVTITSGDQSSQADDVTAIYVNPQN